MYQQQYQQQQSQQPQEHQQLAWQQPQWLSEEQQMLQSTLPQAPQAQNNPTRKRGLANESDEFMGIKKRNLGSDATAQGFFGYPDSDATTPGALPADPLSPALGYFDQLPGQHTNQQAISPGQQLLQQAGFSYGQVSEPTTPSTMVPASSGGAVPLGNTGWPSYAGQGSHSSPPTPSSSLPGASNVSNNVFASAYGDIHQQPLEYRLLQEQQTLQLAQQQEQQNLQQNQQRELQQMQRNQEEMTKATALAKASSMDQDMQQQQHNFATMGASPPPTTRGSSIHHDHNDPATWRSSAQFTGYLGGYGKGYTPAIGGVAALAAASAIAAERNNRSNGSGAGGGGMDMDM